MKKRLLYIVSAALLQMLVVSSCKSFLTVDPTDFVTPKSIKNEKDLEHLWVGCYDALGSCGIYGRTISEYFDMSNDLVMTNNSSAKGLTYYDYNQTETNLDGAWRAFYDGIARCNTFIEAASTIDMDQQKRDVWVAEVRTIRALLYFNLVQYWGNVPLRMTSIMNPTNVSCPPSDKMVVLDTVLVEIKRAEKVLQEMDDVATSYRSSVITKSFAQGLLARIYLRMAGEPFNVPNAAAEAITWAEQVVTDNHHQLNPSYTDVFLNLSLEKYDRQFNEIMFEVEFSTTGKGDSKAEGGYIGDVFSTIIDADKNFIIYGGYNTTRKYYNMFVDHTTSPSWDVTISPSPDTRRDWNICTYYYKGGIYSPNAPQKRPSSGSSTINPYYAESYKKAPGKFYRDKEVNILNATSMSPINFPVMRYAEVLLIIAEAEAIEHGAITERSLWALNQVWHRAAPTEPLKVAADFAGVDDYLSYILDERARELFMEGQRRQDLIRRGIFVETMKNVAVVSGDNTVSFRVINVIDEKHIIFPYPEREMNLNPAMAGKQNVGW